MGWIFVQIPVVSVEVPVDPGGRYGGLPHFSHFGEGISFVGGINRPKRIVCYDRCTQNPAITLHGCPQSATPAVPYNGGTQRSSLGFACMAGSAILCSGRLHECRNLCEDPKSECLDDLLAHAV